MELHLVSDNELIESLKRSFRKERQEQVLCLKRLAEVSRRGLWKKHAKSLNEFCCRMLRISESSAWKRIQVCHLGARLPYALELLADNKITLTNLSILSPCLTETNAQCILEEASGLGRYAVEAIKARYLPKPEPRDSFTPIAVQEVASPLLTPSPAKVEDTKGAETIAIEEPKRKIRVRISYVADDSLVQSMNKVKSLLAHKHPNARLEEIEAEVYRFYLEAHDPEKKKHKVKSAENKPVRHTRYIPVAVENEVWRRDESKCTFRYQNGLRCNSIHKVQMDHIILFSEGGRSDIAENLRLLCSVHNQLEADNKLGRNLMDRFRKVGDSGQRLLTQIKDTHPEVLPSGFRAVRG